MKKEATLFTMVILYVLQSCSPRISTSLNKSYPPLEYQQEVIVLGIHQDEPADCEYLGEVKVGDSGFTTKCGYELVLDKAKMEARKIGGNVLKITEHKPPTALGSTCHRITAKILKVDNTDILFTDIAANKLDIDHAIFYVYRPSGAGLLLNYDLYLGDTVICRVTNNHKEKVRIYKDGLNSIWAKTEAKTEIPVDVELGREYYVRCGVEMGFMVGRPSIELVDASIGEGEYHSIKNKSNSKDVIIRKSGEIIRCEIIKEDEYTVYFSMEMKDRIIKTHLNKSEIERIDYANP